MAISVRPGDREWLAQDPETCHLAVIYEDANSRDTAIELCDRLLHRFHGDLKFDATWWQFRFLSDPVLALQAGRAASLSDIILVTAREPETVGIEVRGWFEQWVVPYARPGGALAWLPTAALLPESRSVPSPYWQGLAQRAQLDFLTLTVPLETDDPFSTVSKPTPIWDTVASNTALEAKYHSSGWGIDD